MADNTVLNSGSGGDTVASDDIAGIKYQRVKLIHGADGVNDGDVANGNPLPVDDAGGSLTVDNAALSVTGGGVESGALRVTIANDSTGVVSIDDGGGSLTIDGTITANAGTGDYLSIFGHTRNEAFKESACIGGELDDTATTAATEGNVSPARITAQRGLHANLRNNAGTEIATSGAPLRVDPTGTTTQPVSDAGGTLTVDNAALSVTGGGVESGALRVTIANDSTGVVSVDDNGGSLTIDGTVTANAGTGDFSSVGNVAHDGVDSGSPVKLGCKAIAHGSNPTAVAAADRTDWYANRAGVPFVMGGHPNIVTETVKVTDANGAQNDIAIATVAGGLKIVVTRVTMIADNANTGDVRCLVGFGATTIPAPSTAGVAAILGEHPGIPAGGGATFGDGSGILGVGADGEDLRYTCTDPVGGNLTISVSYFTVES
jgi:hypothetical protein